MVCLSIGVFGVGGICKLEDVDTCFDDTSVSSADVTAHCATNPPQVKGCTKFHYCRDLDSDCTNALVAFNKDPRVYKICGTVQLFGGAIVQGAPNACFNHNPNNVKSTGVPNLGLCGEGGGGTATVCNGNVLLNFQVTDGVITVTRGQSCSSPGSQGLSVSCAGSPTYIMDANTCVWSTGGHVPIQTEQCTAAGGPPVGEGTGTEGGGGGGGSHGGSGSSGGSSGGSGGGSGDDGGDGGDGSDGGDGTGTEPGDDKSGCNGQLKCTIRDFNDADAEETIRTCEANETLISSALRRDQDQANCTYIGNQFRDESTAVFGKIKGDCGVQQSLMCCENNLFESCRIELLSDETKDQINGSCAEGEFLVSATLSRAKDAANDGYQIFGDSISEDGKSWTGHIAGGYGVDLRLKCCTPKNPEMLNTCTVREFTTTESGATFSCESNESLISGSMYVNEIDQGSAGYVGDQITGINTWWVRAESGSSIMVKLKCCDLSNIVEECIIDEPTDGSCTSDAHCVQLEQDYCMDNYYMHTQGVCVDGNCIEETFPTEDCASQKPYCNSTTYYEFVCNETLGCVETNYSDDPRCCTQDNDCGTDTCNGTMFIDYTCNNQSICEFINYDNSDKCLPTDCNLTLTDLWFNAIKGNLKRHEHVLNVNLYDSRKIYSILETNININDEIFDFHPENMTTDDDNYNYYGILDFSELHPNEQFNIIFNIKVLDQYNLESYCIDTRIVEKLGYLQPPEVIVE